MQYLVGAKYFCGPLPTLNGSTVTVSEIRAAAIADLTKGDGHLSELIDSSCQNPHVSSLIDFLYFALITISTVFCPDPCLLETFLTKHTFQI